MITFKVLKRDYTIIDLDVNDLTYETIINAKVLYDEYVTDKNICHLFYAGDFNFLGIDKTFDLTEFDKVILDFSGADDYWLRYYDIDNVKGKIKAKEIIVISKNAAEKDGYFYVDPLIHRIKQLDFELTNIPKSDLFFFLLY